MSDTAAVKEYNSEKEDPGKVPPKPLLQRDLNYRLPSQGKGYVIPQYIRGCHVPGIVNGSSGVLPQVSMRLFPGSSLLRKTVGAWTTARMDRGSSALRVLCMGLRNRFRPVMARVGLETLQAPDVSGFS